MTMRNFGFILVLLLPFLLLVGPAGLWAAEESGPTAAQIEKFRQEAAEHLQAKRYEEAIRAYYVVLKARPDDSNANYNMACACALLGKKESAISFLERAVEAGFVDFTHIRRDRDLDSLRHEERYRLLLAREADYRSRADAEREEKYRKKLGDRYSFVRDDRYRLLFITNTDARTRARLLSALRRYAEALWRDFFHNKPTYTLTVLVPRTSADYMRDFGGKKGAAGFYQHATRTLTVNLASGTGTMIHEFTHALHFADMEALDQRHPIWIVEGFGSLYEQCRILNDGTAVGLTNWRLNRHLKPGLGGEKTYLPWKKVMDPKSGVFRDRATVGMAYAVTRYIFYYMQQKKVLRKFYRLYREGYKTDPTGVKFLKEVLGGSVEELEKEWKPWVMQLQYSRGRGPRPKVRLGVTLDVAAGAVTVATVAEGSCAEKAGLRPGDVIVEADGRSVKSMADLLGVLIRHKAKDKIVIAIRRKNAEGTEIHKLTVTLDSR
jgi:tetratricopeptide (TPR) repeat protein